MTTLITSRLIFDPPVDDIRNQSTFILFFSVKCLYTSLRHELTTIFIQYNSAFHHPILYICYTFISKKSNK